MVGSYGKLVGKYTVRPMDPMKFSKHILVTYERQTIDIAGQLFGRRQEGWTLFAKCVIVEYIKKSICT